MVVTLTVVDHSSKTQASAGDDQAGLNLSSASFKQVPRRPPRPALVSLLVINSIGNWPAPVDAAAFRQADQSICLNNYRNRLLQVSQNKPLAAAKQPSTPVKAQAPGW